MCVISKRTSSYIFQITTQLDKRLYTLMDLGLFWYYYYKLNLKKFLKKNGTCFNIHHLKRNGSIYP